MLHGKQSLQWFEGWVACYYPDPSRYMVELDRDYGDTKHERKMMRVNIENIRVIKDKYCKNKYRGSYSLARDSF